MSMVFAQFVLNWSSAKEEIDILKYHEPPDWLLVLGQVEAKLLNEVHGVLEV